MASKAQTADIGDLFPVEEPFDQERGWRYKRVTLADGREVSYMVPLTSEDFLNPQEDDVWPQSPLHARITDDLTFMLRTRYTNTNIVVFHDLIINWGIPGLANPSPDISVIPGLPVYRLQDDISTFYVQQEGTKPVLIIEVVSPWYRQEDLVDKVGIYEQAGVHEYVIFDFFSPHNPERGTTLVYRLIDGRYQQQLPDENGFYDCETVDLRVGLEGGERLVLEDRQTGKRLQTLEEVIAARRKAEARAEAEAARAEAAEARLAEMEAELRRLRGEG
jgi:Uma2 family endonuclease